MTGVLVRVESDAVRAVLSEMSGQAFTQRVRSAAAQAARNTLVDHFRSRQAEGNEQGWPSKGFWDGTRADAVTKSIRRAREEGGATVIAIASAALAHRIEGGKVRPTGGRRYLTIPATPEAYMADSARTHLGGRLAFVYGLYKDGTWRPALAATDNYLRRVKRGRNAGTERLARRGERGERGVGAVQFWLVRSATHKPDLRAMPPEGELADAAQVAASAELRLIVNDALLSAKSRGHKLWTTHRS